LIGKCALASFILLSAFLGTASAEEVTISVMRHGYPVEARAFLEKAAAAFNEVRPDVKVEVLDADTNTFQDRIMIWISGGQEPDLFLTPVVAFGDLMSLNAILPLDDIIDQELEDDIPQAVWNVYRKDGVTYGIPGLATGVGLWYNKELFEQAGLDPEAPPTTWDDLIEYGLQIEQNTDAHGIGLNLGRYRDTTQNLAGELFFSGLNGPMIAADGTPMFDSPAGLETLEYLISLVHEHQITQPHPEEYTKTDIRMLLRDGVVAMAIDSPFIMGMLREVTDLSSPETSKFGVSGVLQSTIEGGAGVVPLDTNPWVISANTKHPEAAKAFLRFLVTPEWQYEHDLAVNQTPFRASIWEEMGDEIQNAWIFRRLLPELEQSVVYIPIIPKAELFLEIFNDALQSAVLGIKSPATALNDAADEVRNLNR